MKPDWWTLAAVLIIFIIAVWSYLNTGAMVKDAVKDCKDHYRKQFEILNPTMADNPMPGFEYNLSIG